MHTLFKRYQLPLLAYASESVRNVQTGMDIVQETFINAVRYLDRLQDDAKFGSWLFSIAHQKCIQHWRRAKGEEPFDAAEWETAASGELDPSDWLIRKEEEALFMKSLGELPAVQRSVLLLHFLEHFSLEEIAQITESNPGTVKSRIHYAKNALRKLVRSEAA